MKSVSSIIFDKLVKHSVKDVFLYSGGAIMPLIDRFHNKFNKQINYYINSNEFCLSSSAVGYAKSSNKNGVCITTSGPGLTNCATAILDANADSTPLIVISGQVPLKAMGSGAFQEAPSVDITKAITKFSHCVKSTREICEVLDYAFYIANDKKKGAVHIDIPKCILGGETEHESFIFGSQETRVKIDYQKIADIVNNSDRPVIYVGKGCSDYSEELKKFANLSNIPVTTTLLSLGTFDERDNLSLKMLGMHGSYYANMAIQNADCIIAIGSRFDDRCTGNISEYAPKAKNIIHINIEKSEINKVVKNCISVNDDCGVALNELNKYVKFKTRYDWFNTINKWREVKFTYDNTTLKAQEIIEKLDNLVDKSKCIFTTGVGNHQMYAAQFLTFTHPKQLITSGSLGVMGTCVPYAIGAKIANPDKTVIAIDGDQSFNMSFTDLKTIVNYGLNIKIIIMNNSSQDMVRCWEDLFFDGRNTATLCINPDYCKLARSFGIKGIWLKERRDINAKLKEFLNYDGPALLNCVVEKDFCFPLVKPGSALHDMVLNDKAKFKGEVPS